CVASIVRREVRANQPAWVLYLPRSLKRLLRILDRLTRIRKVTQASNYRMNGDQTSSFDRIWSRTSPSSSLPEPKCQQSQPWQAYCCSRAQRREREQTAW